MSKGTAQAKSERQRAPPAGPATIAAAVATALAVTVARSLAGLALGRCGPGLPPAAAAEPPPSALVNEVALACEQWGFFQVVNHGLDAELRSRAEDQQRAFFALPRDAKEALRRTADNSRGWYDDELTKQRRDWKEGLDFGSTPHWPRWLPDDDDASNGTLDGFNRFPSESLLPEFRPTMRSYFDGLCEVAARLTTSATLALGRAASDSITTTNAARPAMSIQTASPGGAAGRARVATTGTAARSVRPRGRGTPPYPGAPGRSAPRTFAPCRTGRRWTRRWPRARIAGGRPGP